MIYLKDIMNESQKAVLSVFEPALIEKTKQDINAFNQKTKNFLESVKNIKIDL